MQLSSLFWAIVVLSQVLILLGAEQERSLTALVAGATKSNFVTIITWDINIFCALVRFLKYLHCIAEIRAYWVETKPSEIDNP